MIMILSVRIIFYWLFCIEDISRLETLTGSQHCYQVRTRMSLPTTGLISLLLPGVLTLTVDSSVGDRLSLSCPSPGPPCGPACSWRGPHPHPQPHQHPPQYLTVSSDANQSDGVRVSFNQSSCQCLLFIQNASLEHSGLWTCQLKQDGKIYSGATLDRKNIPLNKSEAFLDQPYIKDNQEEWKLS